MNKSIDERLFFKMMHFSHVMKRAMRGPQAFHGVPGHGPHHGFCQAPGPGFHRAPGHGIHPAKMQAFAQTRLMALLLDYEDGVRQKELAKEMRINPSSTSELISKLESEGYVTRTVDPGDKRATLIALTDVGRARAYELEDERNEKFAGVFEALTAEEKEQLLNLLEKIMPASEEVKE